MHKRQLLLRPEPIVNQTIEYVVAVLAERHRQLLHALTGMGNHKHDVNTDEHGLIVEFQRECHSMIARYLNHYFKDVGGMWCSTQPTCRVTCEKPSDIVAKIAYTMANPVAAFLVKFGRSWPGVRRAWPAKPKTVKRPPGFFRAIAAGGPVTDEGEAKWPKEATLVFSRPPGFDHLTDEELAEHLQEAIDTAEAKARKEAEEKKIKFKGRKAIRRQSRYAYPRSRQKRFGIRPQVACRSKWARIEALQRNKEWLADYDNSYQLYRKGEKGVVFPYGTFKMSRYYGAETAPPPT